MDNIPPVVCERLGRYVYAYVDPRNGRPFYVGKGVGERAIHHLTDSTESRKVARVREIREEGLEPQIDILVHRLTSDEASLRVEAAVIDALGLETLTNEVRGWESGSVGRMPLKELIVLYAASRVEVTDPSPLIRVNRLYRYGMSDEELYEIVRGVWVLGNRRTKASLALAVFHGVVRGVFTIESWHPAGSTPYKFRNQDELRQARRWEFVGGPAPAEMQQRYLDRSVEHLFKRGLQSPVLYAAC